jgi:alpha-tubulin suppressor-like RCC1 family protein
MPVSVTCGSNHTAVITRRGDLIAWGMGTSGQTGHGRMACDVRLHATISVPWCVGSGDLAVCACNCFTCHAPAPALCHFVIQKFFPLAMLYTWVWIFVLC